MRKLRIWMEFQHGDRSQVFRDDIELADGEFLHESAERLAERAVAAVTAREPMPIEALAHE